MSVFSREASVISVVHKNKSTLANLADIGGLYIYDASVKFIPTGFKQKLDNLKVLAIYSSGLLSVAKENLKEF